MRDSFGSRFAYSGEIELVLELQAIFVQGLCLHLMPS
jgi:hypothetical protein